MKSLLVIPAVIVFIFQFNSEISAQNYEEGPARIMTKKMEETVSETVDNIVTNTSGYGKGATPLYVMDGNLVPRVAIFNIPVEKVKLISVLKKEAIEERYGKGAVDAGVVEISTDYDTRKVVQGYEIPVSKRPITVVNGKIYDERDLKGIDSFDVKNSAIIQGKAATDKYGEKGKNGVVEITLKDGVTIK